MFFTASIDGDFRGPIQPVSGQTGDGNFSNRKTGFGAMISYDFPDHESGVRTGFGRDEKFTQMLHMKHES